MVAVEKTPVAIWHHTQKKKKKFRQGSLGFCHISLNPGSTQLLPPGLFFISGSPSVLSAHLTDLFLRFLLMRGVKR
jgi:hypothetical protein